MNDQTITAVVITSFLLAMIGFAIKVHRRFPGSFGIMFAGGLGYLFTQMMPMPFYQFIEINTNEITALLTLGCLLSALAAGIARYLIVRWTLSDKLSWGGALSAGLGHGLCESLFLFVFFYMIQLFVVQLGDESGEFLADIMLDRTLADVFIDLIAQIGAIGFHISMYLIIVRGFLKDKALRSFITVCGLQILYTFFKFYFITAVQNDLMYTAAVFLIGILSGIYMVQIYHKMDMQNQIDIGKDEGEKALEEGY